MNSTAQNAARPIDSGRELRSLAYRLAQAVARTTTSTAGARPRPRTTKPKNEHRPDQEQETAPGHLAEAVLLVGARSACTAITAPRPIIRMLRMVGK